MKPEEILSVVAEHYGLSVNELRDGRRTRFRTWARHVAAYLLRRTGRLSQSDIARLLKYGDHTGVVEALQRVRRELEADPQARADLAELEALLGGELRPAEPRRVSRPLFPARRSERAR